MTARAKGVERRDAAGLRSSGRQSVCCVSDQERPWRERRVRKGMEGRRRLLVVVGRRRRTMVSAGRGQVDQTPGKLLGGISRVDDSFSQPSLGRFPTGEGPDEPPPARAAAGRGLEEDGDGARSIARWGACARLSHALHHPRVRSQPSVAQLQLQVRTRVYTASYSCS